MGILDSFERGLERAVNGAFAKTFRSGLQPIEITEALRRELDTKAQVMSRDRILVPNRFTVRLSPNDFDRMDGLGGALVDELNGLVRQHAQRQGYSFAGPLAIALEQDDALSTGVLDVESGGARADVAWTPVLEIDGARHPIGRGRTVIGRGHDADITLADTGTSRQHVAVSWDGTRGQVDDLGSTNGTKLNGQRIRKAILEPDSVIEIGRTTIVFRVVPEEPATPRRQGGR